jgi:hypothetical protein
MGKCAARVIYKQRIDHFSLLMDGHIDQSHMKELRMKIKWNFLKANSQIQLLSPGGQTMQGKVIKLIVFVMIVMTALLPYATGAEAYGTGGFDPIPWENPTTLPVYIGQAAKAQPLPIPRIPQNPFLAANPWNNVHNDSWMSDIYNITGPLGHEPAVLTSSLKEARSSETSKIFTCGTLAFDSRGRIITTCLGPIETSLVMIDPSTLEVLAYLELPTTPNMTVGYGTAYLIVNNQDQAVLNMNDHVWVVGETGTPEEPGFKHLHDYDLSGLVDGGKYPNDNLQSVLPDWQGRLWFAFRKSGLVGVFDPIKEEVIGLLPLNEEIGNSFAITYDATYIVTTKAMYRLEAGIDGVPQVVWRSEYENVGYKKPGQLSPGSGTSPTILDGGKYVAITDNADQLHVLVYRTEAGLPPEKQLVCKVAVFKPGFGATEDSLIGLGRSLIVANEYGYILDENTFESTPSEPGIARVDIDANGKGCSISWTNDAVTAPQVGPKLSTKTGLVYFYTRKYDHNIPGYEPYGLDAYYWTAVDFRTGEIVWERLVGTGTLFNSHYPGPAIGLNTALYVGAYGGIIEIKDTR